MNRRTCLVTAMLLVGSQSQAWSQDKEPPAKKLPDGIYAVQRDSLKEKELLPLKQNEELIVNRHRYQKKDDNEPPRFLVVHAVPEVALDLAREPQADKEGDEVVRIFLKLQPKPAAALERLTRDPRVRQVAIVVAGEVVTMHKIRTVIPNGEVQITSCTPGAATYLLRQLQARPQGK
jgi:hypothetical protein